ncbi:putative bifunctional diguanylate cyclase/phosphodiesterase [Erythrobacter insulae]|nr:EAL domain-containing protein [Erythrobacter insulae]
MFPTHLVFFSGFERVAMVTAAGIAGGVGIFGVWFMRKPEPASQVSLLLSVMNLLVIANIVIALNFGFDQAKMVYFVIIAIAFALASIDLKQSLFSLAAAMLGFLSFATRLDLETFTVYAFVSVGAAIAALAISNLIRSAIRGISESKGEVESELADARRLSARLAEESLSDSLTDLPNRRAFFAKLRETMGRLRKPLMHRAGPTTSWLILLDLDGFKSVNDIHGHLTGDGLLKEVASRLRDFCDDDVFVGRMGGDEFNILIDSDACSDEIKQRCELLLQSLSAPYIVDDRHIRISASIGYKSLDPALSLTEQISQADFALMFAKKHGRNQAVAFNEELAKASEERSQIEHALRRADLEKEIHLVFQPQMNLHTENVVRAEVLARWNSETIGPIEPGRFITIAEESGLITDISLTIIEKAFREIREWPVPLPISLNLSSHDIISKPTIDRIIDLARSLKVDPERVEFEVTETAMMADTEKAIANLTSLKDAGFSIALDDFGTGYSNFSYLRSLPITKLKVDRSFLENPGDPMTEKVLSSLAGMARTLGVHCLLEGIEDEIDLLMARRIGVQSVQGYLFGRPMNAHDLLELARRSAGADSYDRDRMRNPAIETI